MDLNESYIEIITKCELCKGTGRAMVVNTLGRLIEIDCMDCDGSGKKILNLTLFELYDIFKSVDEIQ